MNDSTGAIRHQVWYTAAQAGCAAGQSVCSIAILASLKTGTALWWIQTWGPSGYGPWSQRGEFSVGSPAAGGLRLVDSKGQTVGRMVEARRVVRPINGRLTLVRATSAGFMLESFNLYYTTADCTGQAYRQAELLPNLILNGSLFSGYLEGTTPVSQTHYSWRNVDIKGVGGSCNAYTFPFDAVPVSVYDAKAELGGLVPPFSVVQ